MAMRLTPERYIVIAMENRFNADFRRCKIRASTLKFK